MNYYNEHDPFAAQWLRELIRAERISKGEVDERSITDVRDSDLRGFKQCHFFAGIGVWSYALRQSGWADDREVWTGSCPCQPFSIAGRRGGTADKRHLWPTFYQLIRKCRPSVVFGEQVASKDGLAWLDDVQDDLEDASYSVGAADLCAAGVGAPMQGQRLYFVGEAPSVRQFRRGQHNRGAASGGGEEKTIGSFDRKQTTERRPTGGFWARADWIKCHDGLQRPVEPGTFPLAHGTTDRVGRLRGYGNALVAPQAQAFIEAYLEVKNGKE